jgi:hypothetical protein
MRRCTAVQFVLACILTLAPQALWRYVWHGTRMFQGQPAPGVRSHRRSGLFPIQIAIMVDGGISQAARDSVLAQLAKRCPCRFDLFCLRLKQSKGDLDVCMRCRCQGRTSSGTDKCPSGSTSPMYLMTLGIADVLLVVVLPELRALFPVEHDSRIRTSSCPTLFLQTR